MDKVKFKGINMLAKISLSFLVGNVPSIEEFYTLVNKTPPSFLLEKLLHLSNDSYKITIEEVDV